MKIKMEEEKNKDDGSLSFLNIPRDKNSRHFNCPEITQQKLTNLTFWVIDYMDGVSTKFGKDRALVMIKENLEDKDSDAKKFFTNSQEIKDDRLLMLLDEIIDSAPGVPIGNYLSQYLANLYLAYLDHEIKEIIDIRHYIRYADDMTFFHHDKCFLRNVLLPWLIDRLAVLKLELKGNYQIFKIAERRSDKSGRGVDFVGFVF